MGGNRKFKSYKDESETESESSEEESNLNTNNPRMLSDSEGETDRSRHGSRAFEINGKTEQFQGLVTRSNKKYSKPTPPKRANKQNSGKFSSEPRVKFPKIQESRLEEINSGILDLESMSKEGETELSNLTESNIGIDQCLNQERVTTPINLNQLISIVDDTGNTKEDTEVPEKTSEEIVTQKQMEAANHTPNHETKRKRKAEEDSCRKRQKGQRSASKGRPDLGPKNVNVSPVFGPKETEEKTEKYRSDPFVQKLVHDMVSEQVSAEMANLKRQLNQGKEIEKIKSPSEATLYVPRDSKSFYR